MPAPSLSILLVRKVGKDRQGLCEELKGWGYVCHEGQDALDVLRSLRYTHFDVLVMDLQLPYLSGVELAQYLRADDALKTLMIILLTERNPDFVRPLSAALGFHLLPLPCSGAQIHQTIEGYFSFPSPPPGMASNETRSM